MKQSQFKLSGKSSISLSSMVGRQANKMRATAASTLSGMSGPVAQQVADDHKVAVIVESTNVEEVGNLLDDCGAKPQALGGKFVSAEVNSYAAEQVIGHRKAKRIQTKKRTIPSMDRVHPDINGNVPASGQSTGHSGDGVIVGVVDSGFDLSHPMFRDAAGNLRVDGLLDQPGGNLSFDTAQLTSAWAGGNGPGDDSNGHGTHVATIAAGSAFGQFEGVAPNARFLLAKTDFLNVDRAVSWIFEQAGNTPCVVNLSLGSHFGAHDGSEVAERLYSTLSGPGKIIVAAAGNEQSSSIHIGDRFFTGQTQEVEFDLFAQNDGSAFAVITLWYDRLDRFSFELITPLGQRLDIPALDRSVALQGPGIDIELAKKRYLPTGLKQVQITIDLSSTLSDDAWLSGWGLSMNCIRATIGRLDGWFHNSGFGRFRPHLMVETARTIGMPATSAGVLSVASHVSKDAWDSDGGPQQDFRAVLERNSSFSSKGPSRDGREKPEISAPGQYLTAALSDGSQAAGWINRADTTNRLLTIEGTSMATPVVAGAIAQVLEKDPTLTHERVRQIFDDTCRQDAHTGATNWTPHYGYGKLDLISALNAI